MILVTGAAGHIGNVLVRELVNREEKVRALILPGEDTTSIYGLDIEIVVGNVLDPDSLDRAMRGVDIIYHLAGVISILPDGRRVYEFHPWEKKMALVDTYVHTDVSIHTYLKRLRDIGEDPQRYRSIWYYY